MSSGVNHASGPCLRGHFISFFLGPYAKLHFFPPQGRKPFAHSGLRARGEGEHVDSKSLEILAKYRREWLERGPFKKRDTAAPFLFIQSLHLEVLRLNQMGHRLLSKDGSVNCPVPGNSPKPSKMRWKKGSFWGKLTACYIIKKKKKNRDYGDKWIPGSGNPA